MQITQSLPRPLLLILSCLGVMVAATPARAMLAPAAAPAGPAYTDGAEAEQRVFGLVNAERTRAGLAPLLWDERLALVARAHSVDMRDRSALGHQSPSTGGPEARVRRAGIAPAVLLENVARAYSPRETHEALMRSPGHRRNILHAKVDRIGIGVRTLLLEDGTRELWTTEVFLRERTPFDPLHTPADAAARVAEIRELGGWLPVDPDAVLERLAQQTAQRVSRGELPKSEFAQVLKQYMVVLERYPEFSVLLIETGDVRSMELPVLEDPTLDHYGIGVSPMPPGSAGSTYVVLILGRRSTVQLDFRRMITF